MLMQWIRQRIFRRLVSSLTAAKNLAKVFRKQQDKLY